MKTLFNGALDEEAVQNRTRFFERRRMRPEHVISAGLAHGVHVAVVSESDFGKMIQETDGLVTDRPNVILTVTVADCVPVYFYDPEQQVLGLAHAGWRGVRGGIAQEVIKVMQSRYQSESSRIHVSLGPHVQAHHFEVQEDVAEQFKDHAEWITREGGRIFIDLGSIIQQQLVEMGVLPANIQSDSRCTFCEREDYFSFRRDKPEKLEAMIAYISRSPEEVKIAF